MPGYTGQAEVAYLYEIIGFVGKKMLPDLEILLLEPHGEGPDFAGGTGHRNGKKAQKNEKPQGCS
jgi:hypothetical protein